MESFVPFYLLAEPRFSFSVGAWLEKWVNENCQGKSPWSPYYNALDKRREFQIIKRNTGGKDHEKENSDGNSDCRNVW